MFIAVPDKWGTHQEPPKGILYQKIIHLLVILLDRTVHENCYCLVIMTPSMITA